MTFDQVVGHFKSAENAADKLGVTRQAVYRWKKHGIPHHRQLHIQEKTRGELKADGRAAA